MGVGICFAHTNNGYYRTQWLCNVTGFCVQGYERNKPRDVPSYNGVIPVHTADDLPDDASFVVCSPHTARLVKPTVELPDFEHPEHVVYFFGADTIFLSADDLGERTPDHVVAIPVGSNREGDEIYSFVAGAIVLYDRLVKRGPWWPTP